MEDRQALELDRPAWSEAETRMLDAAVELIAARGVEGVTVAEVARNAGVSRPTVYRRWASADEIVRDVLRFSELFRTDPLYGRLLEREPEVFTRYTLQRIGSSQRVILQWLASAIANAQHGGSVRAGNPNDLAVMLLLIAQSAILSYDTVSALIDEPHWSSELWHALDGHLRP